MWRMFFEETAIEIQTPNQEATTCVDFLHFFAGKSRATVDGAGARIDCKWNTSLLNYSIVEKRSSAVWKAIFSS